MGSTPFQGLMLSVLFPEDHAAATGRKSEARADAVPPAREVIPVQDRTAGAVRPGRPSARAATRLAECCPA